jgi:hypothetical protein
VAYVASQPGRIVDPTGLSVPGARGTLVPGEPGNLRIADTAPRFAHYPLALVACLPFDCLDSADDAYGLTPGSDSTEFAILERPSSMRCSYKAADSLRWRWRGRHHVMRLVAKKAPRRVYQVSASCSLGTSQQGRKIPLTDAHKNESCCPARGIPLWTGPPLAVTKLNGSAPTYVVLPEGLRGSFLWSRRRTRLDESSA